MSAHTPGPWSARNEPMARQYLEAGWEVYWIENKQGSLAEVRRGCEEVTGDIQANARLIAAAPDLLAAFQLMAMYQTDTHCWHSIAPEDMAVIQAAIRKATEGGQG